MAALTRWIGALHSCDRHWAVLLLSFFVVDVRSDRPEGLVIYVTFFALIGGQAFAGHRWPSIGSSSNVPYCGGPG
jgi:hypothetical protein